MLIEAGAGDGSAIPDANYEAQGARIVPDADEVFGGAEMVIKVKEPQPVEVERLRPGQVLFTYLHLAPDPDLTRGLRESGATCIAYETVEDSEGHLPLLAPMSEIAGKIATQAGAFMLEKPLGGRGILLGGVPGVAAANVMVIGGGVVGMNAGFIAIGMGADVFVYDKSIDRLRELDVSFAGGCSTVYSTTLSIEEMLPRADLVIGAVLVHGARAPNVVRREQLALMKPGAVMVDVAIDQGGCFETSHPTTHADPIFEVDGIIHYCVANMPGAVPITATYALTNATLPYAVALADHGVAGAIEKDPGLRPGVNVAAGKVTHQAVAEAVGEEYTLARESHLRRNQGGEPDMSSHYAVVNPATGETVKEYPEISDADLRAAIGRADEASGTWSGSSTVAERAELVRKVGNLHKERSQELAEIIVREMGKPIEQAVGEVDFAGDIYLFYADNAEDLMADEPVKGFAGEGTAVIRRSPFGVLLGIMPWNFPYYQVARFAGPNLVIGNPILLKHASQCPESAEAIAQIFSDAGAPEGVYQNIYATNEQIEWVLADPRVQGVSVTGSERAGAAVAEVAGRNLKKVVLELGGSDPFILLGTDDVDGAAQAAAEARLDNTGQSCNAAKRFIVIDELYDEFVEKLKEKMGASKSGDPTAEDTALGPLSSTSAADNIEDQLKRAVDNGAEVVIGGGRDGNYIEPTILAGIEPGSEASQEEFFGPVAQVYRVGSEEEAVELANQTPFGLGSYLMSTDTDQAERVANQIEAGMVYVNLVLADSPELPFGGVKRSGFGRELGTSGADEFVNKKLIRSA